MNGDDQKTGLGLRFGCVHCDILGDVSNHVRVGYWELGFQGCDGETLHGQLWSFRMQRGHGFLAAHLAQDDPVWPPPWAWSP